MLVSFFGRLREACMPEGVVVAAAVGGMLVSFFGCQVSAALD